MGIGDWVVEPSGPEGETGARCFERLRYRLSEGQ